ncbi:hypothetical protein ABPG77_010385 [Micractinium sp. CCAP 211/92]
MAHVTACGFLLFGILGTVAAQQLHGPSEWITGVPSGRRRLNAAAVPPPVGLSTSLISTASASNSDCERQICIDTGIGLWVEQARFWQANNANQQQTNTAEFDYRPTNNGFTLFYNGEQLADVQATWDSAPYQWPIIRSKFAFRGACACCDLCRAQPNPSAADTSAKCKEWSYRPADRACRLFIDSKGQNQASVEQESSTAYQRNWTSGEAA